MCELLSLKVVRRKLEEGPSLVLLFVSKINPQNRGQTISTPQFTEYSVIKLYRKLHGLEFYFYFY